MENKAEFGVGELRRRGVVRLKEQDMYSVWVKTACCNLNSKQLVKLADITDKFAHGFLLFTTRQIPIIPHVHIRDIQALEEELSEVYLELDRCGPTVRNINVCYDDKICPEAVTNSIDLAEKLDNFFRVPSNNHKVKIGVAGCHKDCVISRVLNDIGFVGVERDGKQGYDVYVGGRLGVNPYVGMKMAEFLSEEECLKFVHNAFELLINEGKGEDRCADLISRLGADRVKEVLNSNLPEGSPFKPVPCESRLEASEANKITVRIRATCGEVTSTQLRKIADIAEKYGKGFVHFVVRGSPEIPCTDESHLENIRKELGQVGMKILDGGIDNLQSCFGNYCAESNADPQSLLRRIEEQVEELGLNNHDIKISASGCPNSCGIANVNDIGFYGVANPVIDEARCNGCELCVPICKRGAIEMKDGLAVIDKEQCKYCGTCLLVCPFDAIVEKGKGFAVLVGGREGKDTRLGEVIAKFLSEEEALQVAERCLRMLQEKKTDVATIIDEIGIEKLTEILVPEYGSRQ